MKISFIVATFNCATEIEQFVKNIQALNELDCEVLISDGGSTDGTVGLLSELPRVKIVKSMKDRGIYDAWNVAIDSAQGEYLVFLGVDDIPLTRFYERALRELEGSKTEPALIFGDAIFFLGNRYKIRKYAKNLEFIGHPNANLGFPHPGALNHRTLFRSDRFNPEYRLAGDFEFYLRKRDALLRMGYFKLDGVQTCVGAGGLSNDVKAFRIYAKELSKIGADSNLNLDFLINRFLWLCRMERIPKVFRLLRTISWNLRGAPFRSHSELIEISERIIFESARAKS